MANENPQPYGRSMPPRRGRRPDDDAVSLGLRKLWQNMECEPIPTDFLDLLDAIDVARFADAEPVSTQASAIRTAKNINGEARNENKS